MIKTLVYQELSILSSREAEVNPNMLMSIKKRCYCDMSPSVSVRLNAENV